MGNYIIIFLSFLCLYILAMYVEYKVMYHRFIKHALPGSIWYYQPQFRQLRDNDSERYKVTIIEIYKVGFFGRWKVKYITNNDIEENILAIRFFDIFTDKFI